ncbi:N-carbamoyl-L-amino-acid hydrolase [Rhizobium sp. BK512]|uniref:Zn-dependent hydrolase n=1 Tax=Rhizobium sp. BK512 TaxID=2587010 RepID=UPI001609FD4C|nr:Zn-dependent hydrolase [Rhizobium sp. BK512]MBB3562659.1 N-carbamoyl-L-amino-acid hydrolase [Rhizobium sp. BK512]
MTGNPEINGERLLERLDRFAGIGATAGGGVNRQALTELDRKARLLLAELAEARGFGVFQDRAANLFVRRPGRDGEAPPLLIGSHLDSQPSGGRFDGALGTLSAFEVLESLEDADIKTQRPIEVVAWTNEEGCRFAPGCMGSSAFSAGEIPLAWSDLVATDGARFGDELNATIASLPKAAIRDLGFPAYAYLELHIEQGPSLEKEHIPIGIVTGIQGTRWLEVTVSGQTAHAGTTALNYRRDPLRAMIAALNGLYASIMPQDERARFTVGRIAVDPGAINAIPQTARCTIDIRHPDSSEIDRLSATIEQVFSDRAGAEHCQVAIRQAFDMPPANFPQTVLEALDRAAIKGGLATRKMLSGAFHDALFVNRVAPAAMIFVPCRDGLSHNEAEYTAPDHVVSGARMLLLSTIEILEAAL